MSAPTPIELQRLMADVEIARTQFRLKAAELKAALEALGHPYARPMPDRRQA